MLRVLIRSPAFFRLWLAQVVSNGGSWLNRVAVLSLIHDLGGERAAVGVGMLYAVELLVRMLPTAALGPLAGPIADRLPRRTLMIAADLLQAGTVLGFLLVREPSDLSLLYGLLFAHMGIAIFFESARTASVPNTVAPEDLHAANALSAVTWSVMLTVGSLSGGLLLGVLGLRGLFLVDAATFAVSALLVWTVRLPPVPKHPEPFRWRDVVLLTDLRRGLAHVQELRLAPAVFAKTFWGSAGGYLVMISLTGSQRFGDASAAAGAAGFAIGALYCARGIGTGIGPVLARRYLGSSDRALRLQILSAFVVSAAGYAFFAAAEALPVAFLCVAFAHMGGSSLWVASTTAWQREVDDAFRGRVFALEFLGMTLGFGAGGLVAGATYDWTGSLESATWTVCAVVLACGAAWVLFDRRSRSAAPG